MPVFMGVSKSMTPHMCKQLCASYKFAAVGYKNKCYCGDEEPPESSWVDNGGKHKNKKLDDPERGDSMCSYPCGGDQDYFACGSYDPTDDRRRRTGFVNIYNVPEKQDFVFDASSRCFEGCDGGGQCQSECGFGGYCCTSQTSWIRKGMNKDCPDDAVSAIPSSITYFVCVRPDMIKTWHGEPHIAKAKLIGDVNDEDQSEFPLLFDAPPFGLISGWESENSANGKGIEITFFRRVKIKSFIFRSMNKDSCGDNPICYEYRAICLDLLLPATETEPEKWTERAKGLCTLPKNMVKYDTLDDTQKKSVSDCIETVNGDICERNTAKLKAHRYDPGTGFLLRNVEYPDTYVNTIRLQWKEEETYIRIAG